MKKLLSIIFLCLILFCGCEFGLENYNSAVFFSPRCITREGFDPKMVQNTFDKGQTIYFCIYSKQPFQSNEGRIQIFKKDPKSPIYGYSFEQGFDITLSPDKNYFTGAFTIYSDGFYLLRVFNKKFPDKPLAQNTFWVAE